jgi:hypothetical protein
MIREISRTKEIDKRLHDEGKIIYVVQSPKALADNLLFTQELHDDFLAKSAGTSVSAAKSPKLLQN